jgi:hypothetical protein
MGAGHTSCAHVALGLCLIAGHIPTHMWRLGSCLCWAHQCTHDAWPVLSELWSRSIGDKWRLVHSSGLKGMDWVSEPMINGSSIRTQFYWVLYQDSMFMDPKILNIIICFINIIIIIKIINKFKRKYYYLYYKVLWHFL